MHTSLQQHPHLADSTTDHYGQQTRFVAQLDATITNHIGLRQREAATLSADYGRMWSYILSIYLAGGKRLRPYLALASFQAFKQDGTEPDMTGFMDVATAIEFIHMAMLIHDDIIDRDYIRHGQANISGLYRQHYQNLGKNPGGELDDGHYADSAAMLAGDALISEAYRMIMGADIKAAHKDLVAAAFGQAVFEVVGGELLDTEAVYYDASLVDSRTIARLKTASYSCVMPLTVGAILAGAALTPSTITAISDIGSAIGIAFQMADDELGVFGDEAVTGKSACNDIREQKRTMLLQRALAMATPADHAVLTSILAQTDLSEEMAVTYRQIIERSGARAAHAADRQAYANKAYEALAGLPINQDGARELAGLLRSMAERYA